MSATVVKSVLKYGLAVALLAFVVTRNWRPATGPGLADMLDRPAQPLPLLMAFLILAAAVIASFVRWWFLVRAQGLPFRLADALRLGAVGYFFNTFLPGSIGGDIVKAVGIARGQARRTVAVATVLFDRFGAGLWGLIWLVALLGGAFWLAGDPLLLGNPKLLVIVRTAWVVVVLTTAAWLLLGLLSDHLAHRFASRLSLTPKVGHALAELWRAVWMYRRRPGAVALALVMTLGIHTANVLAFHYAARAFVPAEEVDQLPTAAEDFLVVPVVVIIEAGFPTPGGAGAGEAAFGWLYRDVLGRPAAFGVMASLVLRAIKWVIGLIGYIMYLRMKPALPAADVVRTDHALAAVSPAGER